MPSTTFHLTDELLSEIDRAARVRGQSRNRFVVEACRDALARKSGEWPKGFFDPLDDPQDATMLAEASRDLETAVLARRRNRGAVAL